MRGFRKRAAFNQFQFIGLTSEALIAGIAIIDLKWIGSAFVYVYDLKTHELYERSFLQPFATSTIVEPKPDTGTSRFVSRRCKVEMAANGDGSERYLHVDVGDDVALDVTLFQPADFVPLRICSKAGYAGWVYTQKAASLAAEGSLRVGGKAYTLARDNAHASCDWSCGFMRRETAWNWACFSGRSAHGRSVGLNLAAGVNETGVTENCLWVDGQLTKLGMAVFDFERYKPEAPWHVETTDGLVDLSFQPCGKRQEKINAVFMASNFKQMFGHFRGYITDRAGNKIDVERIPGFMEDHYAKW